MKDKPLLKRILSFVAIGFSTGAAFLVSPEVIPTLVQAFSDTAQSEIAQAGFFFTIAALLHSGRMKKEIRLNFEALTISIDKVAKAFHDDLKHHSEKIDGLSHRVSSLEIHNDKLDNLAVRVASLESNTKPKTQ